MLTVKKGSERVATASRTDAPVGLVIAAALDTVIDGFIIGAGFAVGSGLGLALVIALGLELSVLTLSIASEFRKAGISRWRTGLTTTGVSLTLLVGAATGAVLLAGLSPSLIATLLAFAAAALLYLATEELLLKAHKAADTTRAVAVFFLGFFVLMAFTLLGPG